MSELPELNPYSSPLALVTPLEAQPLRDEARPNYSPFPWFCLGHSLVTLVLMSLVLAIGVVTGDPPDGFEVILAIVTSPILAAMFAGPFGLWWMLRNRSERLTPSRTQFAVFGAVTWILQFGVLLPILFLLMYLSQDSIPEWMTPVFLFSPCVIGAELCKVAARRSARRRAGHTSRSGTVVEVHEGSASR